jgi:hypothetical protein
VATAHYWNRKPSELGLCEPEDDPAVMMCYYLTVKAMEGYEYHLQEVELAKVRRKGKR